MPRRRRTEIKDRNGRMIYEGDTVRFVDKREWYKTKLMIANLRGDAEMWDEILNDHEKYPFEDRIVEFPASYEWLLSSEIQSYWEVIDK